MVVTIWDIFRYIFKWKFFIAIVTVAAVILAYIYVDVTQSYSSEVIFKYEDSSVSKEGKTPDGATLDTDEIISPVIISKALDDINVKYGVDTMRSSLTVTPITPTYVTDMKDAKTKVGEEYNYYPVQFTVKYKDKKNSSIDITRDFLDAIMTNYVNYYCEKYINQASVVEIDYDMSAEKHDYLEIAEIMQSNITTVAEKLSSLDQASESYRSPSTGLTFNDLNMQYSHIKNFDLPELFANIYAGQITEDKDLLITKYQNRNDEFLLSATNDSSKAAMTLSLMKSFANANKDVPNSYNYSSDSSNNDNLAINDEVINSKEYNSHEKATYDNLITDYTKYTVSAKNNSLDAKHCRDIIDIFSKDLASNVNQTKIQSEVEKSIESIKSNYQELCSLTEKTLNDYNAYVASTHITFLTGVKVYKNVAFTMYGIIAFVAGLALSIIWAVSFELVKRFQKLKAEGIVHNDDETLKSIRDDGDDAVTSETSNKKIAYRVKERHKKSNK